MASRSEGRRLAPDKLDVEMQLTCPSCGASIGAADVNLDRALAKCVRCNTVFDFSDEVRGPSGGGRMLRRHSVPMPASLRIIEGPPMLVAASYRQAPQAQDFAIVRRWFSPGAIFMVFFCIAWDGFLVFWYSAAMSGHAPWIFILFPIIHVAVGVSLTYATICTFVNKTFVRVRDGVLEVRHAPLPWKGNRVLPVDAVEQLYCQQHESRNRNSTTFTYSLNAMMKDGRKLSLLTGLPEPEQALFMEQRLEERLGIVDVEVEGEYIGR
jgi:predicted Zn finger-like uncharacterized protein